MSCKAWLEQDPALMVTKKEIHPQAKEMSPEFALYVPEVS